MRRGSRRPARALALGLALAMFASAAGAGVSALGGKHIALGLEPSFPASEPLVTGDVLRLDVTADADFPAYSNSTVIYYDSRYFAPCDSTGTDFGTLVQGEGIAGYLELNAANPLCRAGAAVFGSVNVPAADDYAAIALQVPYDLENKPAAATPGTQTPWFTFYLKARQATPTGTQASIFMSRDALRTAENRSAVMYYSAAPGGSGWLDVDVALPARLDYAIETAAADPVTVRFEVPAGARGSLTGGITSVRNIEWGTTLAEQIDKRWPGARADTGFHLAGWTYPGEHEQGPLPDDTVLGEFERVITLVPVFMPNDVTVQLYLLDLSLPSGAQEIDLGGPLPLRVGFPFGEDVDALLPVVESYPVDTGAGYSLDILTKDYVVPEIDDETLRVEIARVHRGTWFVGYLAGGGDVTGLPDKQAKSRGESVPIAAGPARRGYTFLHWTDGLDDYNPGQSWSADADLTLTAVWGQNPPPAVEGGASKTLQYKSTATLRLTTSAPGQVTWSSSNAGVVSVNANTGEIRGGKTGTAVVTGRDGDGFTASVTVKVSYAWWQWLIVILLFGWIWY